MWERYADDVFQDAKQSSPNDQFTEQIRVSLLDWTANEGAAELAASKDTYVTLRRKLAELAGIPLRDSSRRKQTNKRGTIMSSSPDRSPFDDLARPAHVPTEMSPRITVQDINTAEPGPYYVYIPGIDAEGLKDMLHSPAYATIPAGELFRIGAIEDSMLAGRLDQAVPHKLVTIMHPIEQKVMDRLHVIAIPASTTLNALKSDRSITAHVIAHVEAFDRMDNVEYQSFNDMIRPLVRYPDGTTGRIKELSRPEEYRKELAEIGMLGMRLRWLQEAAEKLETGRMLEVHRSVIDKKPFLRDIWLRAINDVLLPSIDQFRIVAETRLSAVEDRMRNPQNSDNYDRYSFKLMWLLGRQPERTALTRTLDSQSRGGLSPEEVKIFVANEIARQTTANGGGTAVQATRDQVQCDECGEMLNAVKGGYPRKCRFCGFEFRPTEAGVVNLSKRGDQMSVEASKIILPEEVEADTAPGIRAAAELDEAVPLVAQGEEVIAAPAGEGLSAEDEAEIEDMAANILKGNALG